MDTKSGVLGLKRIAGNIDWQLLLFLTMALQVKLVVKVAGILLFFLMRRDFRFGFAIKNSRLPLFYPGIIAIAFVGLLVNKDFLNLRYDVAFVTGICFWGMCILAIHQVKLFVDSDDAETIDRTIIAFFVLNAVISFINLLIIIAATGAANPYLYQGEYQKYFISTGDYIKGITFDTSTTNAILNSFGIIYFLTKKNMLMVLVCMTVFVLTASNFTNLLLLIVFTGIFIFQSDRSQKSMIVICVLMLVIFLGRISPQNDHYVSETLDKYFPQIHLVKEAEQPTADQNVNSQAKMIPVIRHIDTIKTHLESKEIKLPGISDKPLIVASIVAGERPSIPKPNINKVPYQVRNDTSDFQISLFRFINQNKSNLSLSAKEYADLKIPGKLLAYEQTMQYMRKNPQKIVFGDGVGNFSSKLAFRTTGLRIEGGYPAELKYISPEFLSNHFDIYLYFFSNRKGLHSLINTPDSVYDQLFSEYGVVGLMVFGVFYLGYFIKRIHKYGFALPMIFLLTGIFTIGYWFEQLSVVLFFELLIFLYMKEEKNNIATDARG